MLRPREKSMIGSRGCFRLAAKGTGCAGLLLLAGCVPFVLSAALPAAQPELVPPAQPNPLSPTILLPPMTQPPPGPKDQAKALPISLDTAFPRAQAQIGTIAMSREQLNDAF